MTTLHTMAIKTALLKESEDLIGFLLRNLDVKSLEGKVLAVTSKIIALSEGRVVAKDSIGKAELVKREADIYLGEIAYECFLTVKHGLFIASAGIDESNCDGEIYILYPVDPFASAERIRAALAEAGGLKHFGVVVTDSHTSPLRAGVTGIALAHAGFRGVRSRIGHRDLFGRPLKMTQVNVADAVASAAVYCMGEADECCPLAVVETEVDFTPEKREEARKECIIPADKDLYAPLFKNLL